MTKRNVYQLTHRDGSVEIIDLNFVRSAKFETTKEGSQVVRLVFSSDWIATYPKIKFPKLYDQIKKEFNHQ